MNTGMLSRKEVRVKDLNFTGMDKSKSFEETKKNIPVPTLPNSQAENIYFR